MHYARVHLQEKFSKVRTTCVFSPGEFSFKKPTIQVYTDVFEYTEIEGVTMEVLSEALEHDSEKIDL